MIYGPYNMDQLIYLVICWISYASYLNLPEQLRLIMSSWISILNIWGTSSIANPYRTKSSQLFNFSILSSTFFNKTEENQNKTFLAIGRPQQVTFLDRFGCCHFISELIISSKCVLKYFSKIVHHGKLLACEHTVCYIPIEHWTYHRDGDLTDRKLEAGTSRHQRLLPWKWVSLTLSPEPWIMAHDI